MFNSLDLNPLMCSDHNTINSHRDPIDQVRGPIDHTCGAIG